MSKITLLDYNLMQLRKTFNKKYENYIISRILHGINSVADDVQMITQQYVKKDNKYYFTDLYFPQFNLHFEIDEYHHDNELNKTSDQKRELEIVEVTSHNIEHIRISEYNNNLELLNNRVDEIISKLLIRHNSVDFKPWTIGDEYSTMESLNKYANKGYVEVSDNLRFRKIMDASNFFGQDVKGMQRAFFKSKKYPEITLWFPKFYSNLKWDNKLIDDEKFLHENGLKYGDLIQEKPLIQDESLIQKETLIKNRMEKHYEHHINESGKRIVLPRFRDNLGFIVYKFMGIYQVDKELSSIDGGMIYRRISENFNLQD